MSIKNTNPDDRLPLSTLYQVLIEDPFYSSLPDGVVRRLVIRARTEYLVEDPFTAKIDILFLAWARMKNSKLSVFKKGRKTREVIKDLPKKYSGIDAFLKLETTYGSFREVLSCFGLPAPYELFPRDINNTKDRVEKDETEWDIAGQEITEIGNLEEELDNVRIHLDSLEPSHPEYLRIKKEGEAEVWELNSKISDKQDFFDEKIKTLRDKQGQKETVPERNKRLQRRFNQIFPTYGNMQQTLNQLHEEEKGPGGSGISYENLRRRMIKPK